MPPFTRKRPIEISTPVSPTSDAEAQLASAQSALDAHLAEAARLQADLADIRQRREELMREGGDIELITSADREIYRVNLQLEQAEHRLQPLHDALTEARQAVHWERWLALKPGLQEAEEALAASITSLYDALARLHQARMDAHSRGFGGYLAGAPAVPPGGVQGSVVNDYSLRQFLAHHAGRKVPVAA